MNKISIIIPTYNRSHLVLETLYSISTQTYSNWECIIIDDGSTDETKKIINQFISVDLRFRYFDRPKNLNKGASSCRNYGFSLAKGNFIQFFDSDDIMDEKHLEEKMKKIGNDDFVVCKVQSFEGKFDFAFNFLDIIPNIKISENLFEDFVTGNFPMMMMTPMWKRQMLYKHMPIREDLNMLEDHELYARCLFDTCSMAIVNKPLIFYRTGGQSITYDFYSKITLGLDSYFKAKKTVLLLSSNTNVKKAILKMTLGFFRMSLAQKDYYSAKKCLKFIRNENLNYTFLIKLKLVRIYFFFLVFKTTGKGDTKFKKLLKL